MLYKKGLGWPTTVNSKWLYSVSPLSKLGTKFIGNEIRFYKYIRSTQTLAISLAENGSLRRVVYGFLLYYAPIYLSLEVHLFHLLQQLQYQTQLTE